MLRDVLHLRVPSFPVAIARLADPGLRTRPVAVSGGGPRGVVLSVSREARAEGVRKGMMVAQARRYCRGLLVAPFEPGKLAEAQRGLMGLAEGYTPVWEPARPGHLYLDMTGSRRLFGPPCDTASRLAREVARRMGLASGVGVAQNKLVASVASKVVEEDLVCEVMRGDEAAFLSPLGLDLLPGLGEKRLGILGDWNVRSIGEFRSIPLPRLEEVFGSAAAPLHERAAGIDLSPVVPPGVEEKIVRGRVLSFDEIDDEFLLAHVSALLEEGCRELRTLNKAARRIELSLRYSDGMESARTRTLKPPLFLDFELKPVARELFFEASSRRVRVRKIGITLGKLCPVPAQMDLFGDSPEKARRIRLQGAVDEIRDQFGFPLIGFAVDLSALGAKDEEE